MNRKIVIGIVVIIVIVSAIVVCIFSKKDKKDMVIMKDKIDTVQYYGRRGNITDLQRIKFLSKNDEYLVGMIGLPVANEAKAFSNDEMIRFALNVAVERYSTMLDKKKDKDGSFKYVIERETVNAITKEFFGIDRVEFDEKANKDYSSKNSTFLFDESIEKTLYYYPVTQENKENGACEIIVDAIFVSDVNFEELELAKYEGKYLQNKVDNTVKFVFDESGKLVSYQYL